MELVEVVVVALLLRGTGLAIWRLVLVGAFANLATHPSVWFVFTQLFLVGTTEYVVAAEGFAIVVEALFFWVVVPVISPARAIAVAVTANALSFVIGRAVQEVRPELLGLPT